MSSKESYTEESGNSLSDVSGLDADFAKQSRKASATAAEKIKTFCSDCDKYFCLDCFNEKHYSM
jgi:hypothetical protein